MPTVFLILLFLAVVVVVGVITGVVLITTRNKPHTGKRSKKPIIILAVIIVVLNLLFGFFQVTSSLYVYFGVPLRMVQFIASILFLVFCIFVDKKPELTVIPKCLLVADYASYFVFCLIKAYYPMRVLLRYTIFDNIDLLLTVIFLVIYFMSVSAKIRSRETARTLTIIFGILSSLYNPSVSVGFEGVRSLINWGGSYAIEILTVIAMIMCVSRFSKHQTVSVEDEAEPMSESVPVAAPVAAAPAQTPGEYSDSLFETDFLVVDEKVRAFAFGSAYGIYAEGTDPVGFVRQSNISGGAKAAQIMFGRKMKNMQSFEFVITDASGKRVGGISRKGMSFISVEDASGNIVGRLKFGKLVADDGRVIATAKAGGLTKTRILDEDGTEMATINYKWNGVVKTLLTSADKYLLLFANDLDPVKKANVLAICIAFDFVSSS